jgi:hypothetical protein
MSKGRVVAVGLCLALAVALFPTTPALATSCVVKNKRSGRAWGADLQRALDGSVKGAVLVISGTCIGTFTIHKDVTLRGKPVVGHPSPTLDGGGKGTVLTIAHTANVTLTGLRIQGGKALGGGGIVVGVPGQHAHNSIVRLINTLVTGNTARNGGGIFAMCCHFVILRGTSAIRGNSSDCRGGGALTQGNLWLKDTSVVNRNTSSGGSAARCSVPRRFSGLGGGIYDGGSVKLFDSASVTRNHAANGGGGVFLDGDLDGSLMAHRGWTGKIRNNDPNDCLPAVTLGGTTCD